MRDRRRERQHSGSAQRARKDGERMQSKGLAVLALHGVPRFTGLGLAVFALQCVGIVVVGVLGGGTVVVLPEGTPTQGIVRSDDDKFGVGVRSALTQRVELDLG